MNRGVPVSCRALTKRFGGSRGIVALDGLDLDIPAGSVFGLLGPNGAGKTTTLRLITGLARPTGGGVEIGGARLDPNDPRGRQAIGVLDQEPRYYGWMTGRELVELAGRLQGLPSSDAATRAAATLGQVGLTDATDRRIGGYSGGMRQRLGIAQALVAEPSLLVLDEPVSSLDPEGRRDLLGLIADLRGTATVLLSTHVLDDVERICDRVAILDHGRLVAEGPLDDLLARYAQPLYRLDAEPDQAAAIAELARRLSESPWVDGVTVRDDVVLVSVTDATAAAAGILPLVVAADVRLASFERVRPSLEDIFLRLVGRNGAGAARPALESEAAS